MTVKVTFKDTGLRKLRATLRDLASLSVTVGFQGGGASDVATIAAFNEFGTINMPSRPFMRSAFLASKGAIARAFAKALRPVILGRRKPVVGLAAAGKVVAEIIRKRIDGASGWATPLAQETIDKKGHSRPLIDSGNMRESLTWAVRRGGTIIAQGQ